MNQDVVIVIEQLLAKAPQWLRQDMMSSDPLARRRAEETLAAMIAAALPDGAAAAASHSATRTPQSPLA